MAITDIIYIFSVAAIISAVLEYTTNVFVYQNKRVQELTIAAIQEKGNLKWAEDQAKKVTGTTAERAEKKVADFRNSVQQIVAERTQYLMFRSTLPNAVLSMLVFWHMGTVFANVQVATLPFEPTWMYPKMIFQRGLGPDAAPNAASYMPFVIIANTFIRPLVARLLGTAEAARRFNESGAAVPNVVELAQEKSDSWVKSMEKSSRKSS